MICEVYHYDRSKDRSVLAGTLTLNGEEITIEASKGCENTMESVKELSAMSDGGEFNSTMIQSSGSVFSRTLSEGVSGMP